jgi:hypothetical protein
MVEENQKKKFESQDKYRKAKQTPMTFKLHNELDKDILEYFAAHPDERLSAFRTAFRSYIKKQNKKNS